MDTTLIHARQIRDTLAGERFAGTDQNPEGIRDITTCVVSGVERLQQQVASLSNRLETTAAAEQRALNEAVGAQNEVTEKRQQLIDARGRIEVLEADVRRLQEQVRVREAVMSAAWHWYRTGDGDALASALARLDTAATDED